MTTNKVAVIQASSVPFDAQRTAEKAERLIS